LTSTSLPLPPSPDLPSHRYNELSTLTIKKTSATTQSVANTAKRVIVIVGVALALGESLEPLKMVGCGIGIGGVLLYSLVK
jgi:solute carrier family 35 protein E1